MMTSSTIVCILLFLCVLGIGKISDNTRKILELMEGK
jgi:hypothetical protein